MKMGHHTGSMAAMMATLLAGVVAAAAAAEELEPVSTRVAVAETLTWPVSVGGNGYSYGDNLGTDSQDTFTMTIPVLPPSVPAQLFSQMTLTVQCSGCGWASCLTVSTTAGGCGSNSYCDDNVHTCYDTVPFLSYSQNTYVVTISNENIFFDKTYTMQLQQSCTDGTQLTQYACMPTVATPYGTYADAVVFDSPAQGLIFGMDGCSGQTNGYEYSCCWDGGPVSQVSYSNGVQSCAPPACDALPPSPVPQPSPSSAPRPSPSSAPHPSSTSAPGPSYSSAPIPAPNSGGGGGGFQMGSLSGPPAYVLLASVGLVGLGIVVWIVAALKRRAGKRRQEVRGIDMQRLRSASTSRGRDEVAVPLLAGAAAGGTGTGSAASTPVFAHMPGSVCGACQSRNPVGNRFCESCGATLAPPATTATVPPAAASTATSAGVIPDATTIPTGTGAAVIVADTGVAVTPGGSDGDVAAGPPAADDDTAGGDVAAGPPAADEHAATETPPPPPSPAPTTTTSVTPDWGATVTFPCGACSRRNPAGCRFCEGCGAALTRPATPTATGVPCPACHKRNPAGHRFCEGCGAPTTGSGGGGGTIGGGGASSRSGGAGAGSPAGAAAPCSACGKRNAPGARFCEGCGAAAQAAATPATPAAATRATPVVARATPAVCRACGAQNAAASRFCERCGAATGT